MGALTQRKAMTKKTNFMFVNQYKTKKIFEQADARLYIVEVSTKGDD